MVPVSPVDASRIRTIWRDPGCKPTRTDGTPASPDLRADDSETHAAMVRTAAKVMTPRQCSVALNNRYPQCIAHSVECDGNVLITVGSRHEARLKRGRREVDPSLERRMKETTEQLHIGTLGISKITNGFGAEEKSPHRSGTVSSERNVELTSDLLQTFDQRGGSFFDAGV